VLAECDYLTCDCARDVPTARELGFRGDVLPVFAAPFGLNAASLKASWAPGPPSSRRRIVLKGYQGWVGRALTGIRALERNAELLDGYTVTVVSPGYQGGVHIAAEFAEQATGVPFQVMPHIAPEEMFQLLGSARLAIGLSTSDGTSATFLEAMATGAFPIQSSTACVEEWARDGETALFVHPDDSDDVAQAIRRALMDDALVDSAAEMNARLFAERLDSAVTRPQVIAMYERIAARGSSGRPAAIAALSEPGSGLTASYETDPPITWAAGRPQRYAVALRNTGARSWHSDGARCVRLGIQFLAGSGGRAAAVTDERFNLPEDLAPGGSVELPVVVNAPRLPGRYVLRHRMLRESVAWFDHWVESAVTVTAR
jgi:hypothetical protein